METEPVALAASGAAAVIALMTADGWPAARPRVAALLSPGGAGPGDAVERARVEGELEREHREAARARAGGDAATLRDLEAVWRSRLRRLLADDTAAAALRALVAARPAPGGACR